MARLRSAFAPFLLFPHHLKPSLLSKLHDEQITAHHFKLQLGNFRAKYR